jgi:hypothetical protein
MRWEASGGDSVLNFFAFLKRRSHLLCNASVALTFRVFRATVDDTTTLSAEKQQCEMTILVHHKLKD